jgi:hypothetical protein
MLKRFLQNLSLAAVLTLSLFVLTAPVVFAQNAADVCNGVAAAGASCVDNGGTSVNDVIGLVVNTLSSLIGVVAVIMIMVGGYKYITSSGDSSNIASAKNTILFAIVGLIVVALAQIIVRFVLQGVL